MDVGIDVSLDGVLQTAEIQTTAYVCNGTNGGSGGSGGTGGSGAGGGGTGGSASGGGGTGGAACDPNGTYSVDSGPITYACCQGFVNVNVSSFIISDYGAFITTSPGNPLTLLLGSSFITCPGGSFANTGSIPGGCTETYTLEGTFTDADTWTGTYRIGFVGADCSCLGGALGTPCVDQAFPVTARR